MKKKYLFTLFVTFLFSTTTLFASMEFWVDYKVFSIPNDKAFVETYLNFTGSSMTYAALDSGYTQANTEILYYFKQGEKIISFKKINLSGPMLPLGYEKLDFLDLQRFSLDDGNYDIIIEVTDLNNPEDLKTYRENFNIQRPKDKPFVSDICFIKGYSKADETTDLSKSGYNLLPFVSNYFPSTYNSLIMYAEVYQTDKLFGQGEKYALYYFIEDVTTGLIKGENRIIKRQEANEVTPIIHTFDISEISSGNYNLVVEIRNKNNELITRQEHPFYRNKYIESPTQDDLSEIDVTKTFTNQYQDRDELLEHIKSLEPIASTVERATINNLIPEADITVMQQYLYYFWARRDIENAENNWNEYAKNVRLVNDNYGSQIKKGYQTERGRVYLTYGSPNSIAKRHNNPSMAPYEIWHYYQIDVYSNKRFLFYDPTKTGLDFTLLNSDMPHEISEKGWYEIMLKTSKTGGRGSINGLSSVTNDGVNSDVNSIGDAEGEILKDLYFHTR